MEFVIKEALAADAAGMLSIYNEVVETSTAIYCDDFADLDYMQAYISERESTGFPVFVARLGDSVLGYGSYGMFRARPGYRFTVEHSVHVSADARGQGIGAALLAALIERAKADGYHVMIGAVDSANAGSLRFHERAGFQIHSALPEIGRKFDRWLDMTFVTLSLG